MKNGLIPMKSTRTPIIISSLAAASLLLSACGNGGAGEGDGGDGEAGQMLRLALNQSEDHPSFIALENFNEHLEENTDGWGIDVYPNETLGAQAEALQLVSDGSVDMAIVSGAQLENLNDDFMVFNLPRVFDDVEHQMDVIHDEDITGELYSSLEDSASFTVLGGFTQGSRSVYTTDGPVETPDDLNGQNLRIQESPINIAMAEALGGSATPMAYGELYTGLQSGVVDAAENNEVSYYTQGHYEVAPYWSYTNHLVGLDYLIINADVLESMSDEDRATFDEGWTAAHEEHTELWAEATEEAIEGAEAGGAEFSEVDDAAFDDQLIAMVDEFITTDSQEELHDAARDAAQ